MPNVAEILGARLEEWLSCFVLLGFDDHGNHVEITHMPTPKDAAAIASMIQYAADNIECGTGEEDETEDLEVE